MALRIGTCNLCGEAGVELFVCDELPAGFEGVGCASCGKYHAEAADTKRQRDHEKWLDRLDDVFAARPGSKAPTMDDAACAQRGYRA